MIRALVALLIAFPLAAAAVPERPVSDARIGISSTTRDWRPTVAGWNGERFLVAWHSTDRGAQALVLDGNATPIAETATGLPFNEVHAVFWRDGAWMILSNDDWVRVDENGVLLDRTAHRLPLPAGTLRGAVWTGEALLVAVQRTGDEPVLSVVVFDESLQLRGRHDFPFGGGASVHLATDGETALLAFHQGHYQAPLELALFSRTGALERQATIGGAFYTQELGTRGNGNGYVLGTVDFLSPPREGVTLRQVNHQLHVDTITRFATDRVVLAVADTLSWDGTAFTFLYHANVRADPVIRAARIAPNGAVIEDAPVLSMHGVDVDGAISSFGGGGKMLLFHHRQEDGFPYLRMRAGHNVATLAAARDVDFERSAFQQIRPAVATTATQALVVWQERVIPRQAYRVYATRVDSRGRILDPQSIHLGTSLVHANLAVASNGAGYLVAWHDATGIRTAQVRTDGSIAARGFIERTAKDLVATSVVKVFSNGTDYVLAWTEPAEIGRRPGYLTHVSADGIVTQSLPYPLGDSVDSIEGASDGRDYLIVANGAANGSARLIDGGDARTLVQFPIGPAIPSAIWWNGTAYDIVQGEGAGYRLVRITPQGVITISAPASSPVSFSGHVVRTVCETRGCTRYEPLVENGIPVLREIRISERNGNAMIARGTVVEIAPFAVPERFDSVQGVEVVPFRLEGRTFAAFSRPALEVPYAGIHRIFILSVHEPMRTRAVRH